MELKVMKSFKRRFTTMEVCIVLIILAIMAAISVPRLSHASSEARLSKMIANLQKIRSNIVLYKIQHDNLLPGQKTACGDITEADFIIAMTTKGADGLGPYLKKMPVNPFMDGEAAEGITCVNDAEACPEGTESTGWWLNVATGEFRACDCAFHGVY